MRPYIKATANPRSWYVRTVPFPRAPGPCSWRRARRSSMSRRAKLSSGEVTFSDAWRIQRPAAKPRARHSLPPVQGAICDLHHDCCVMTASVFCILGGEQKSDHSFRRRPIFRDVPLNGNALNKFQKIREISAFSISLAFQRVAKQVAPDPFINPGRKHPILEAVP